MFTSTLWFYEEIILKLFPTKNSKEMIITWRTSICWEAVYIFMEENDFQSGFG